jgi:hypothetical protein
MFHVPTALEGARKANDTLSFPSVPRVFPVIDGMGVVHVNFCHVAESVNVGEFAGKTAADGLPPVPKF